MTTVTATDRPLLTPPLSTVGWWKIQNSEKKQTPLFMTLFHHRPILGIRPEVCMTPGSGLFGMAQTDIQTHTHKLSDRNGPEGPVSETRDKLN